MECPLDTIIEYGQEFNKDWIDSHPKHWLTFTYENLHLKSSTFLLTSCEITAAMIKWKLGYRDDWYLLEESDGKNFDFEEIQLKYPIFQVSIGEDFANNEHVVTIIDGYIVQSYFGKNTINKNLLTPNIIRALNSKCVTNKNYSIITRSTRYPNGIEFKGDLSELQIYYWVPNILS